MTSVPMSVSVSGGESYPGCRFTLPQLLYAAKMKLRDSKSRGRYVRNPESPSTTRHKALNRNDVVLRLL